MAPYRLTGPQLIQIPNLWKNLATEYNGSFRKIHATAPSAIAGAFNESTRFELHIPISTSNSFVLTAGEQHYLKAKYEFKKDIGFKLQIHPEDVFEKINKVFGGQDLKIGHPAFDKKYIIKTNNPSITKNILDNKTIDVLLKLNTQSLEVDSMNESQLFFMPFIREENEFKMKLLIRFIKDIIMKINDL